MNWNMKLAVLGLALGTWTAFGQGFATGSTGSYGPLNITSDTTLDVPTNGVFNCTTINISKTLKFRKNAANDPVYLLATGNVIISGTIDVNAGGGNGVVGGQSGPGGFEGGSPGSVSVPPGSGFGPGAGTAGLGATTVDGAGAGSFGLQGASGSSTRNGSTYGNALLIPMVGGSGGGGTSGSPGAGGGGGGGAVLVASPSRIDLTGQITANGGGIGGGAYNGGSGGSIRLVAPVVAGNGTVAVYGGTGGGNGRIRIDAVDRTQMGFTFPGNNAAVTSVGSLLLVFPTPTPRLDILEAAGTAIAEGSGPVSLLLPFGSSPNRTIKVQARDFNAEVPITLVLTPDHGSASNYTGKIVNTGANNPATLTLDVVLPVNEQTTVNVYSK